MTTTKVEPINKILDIHNNKRPKQQMNKPSNKKDVDTFFYLLEEAIKKQGGK